MPTSLFDPIIQGARPAFDFTPKKIGEGLHWTAPHNVSVGTVTAVTVLLEVPATGVYHLRGQVQADKAGTWTLSTGPTCSAGTAMTALNNNRRATNTTNITLSHTVSSYSSIGTAMAYGLVGADSGPMSLAVDDRSGDAEWILATSGTYLVRFVAGAAATNVIVTLRYWKES